MSSNLTVPITDISDDCVPPSPCPMSTHSQVKNSENTKDSVTSLTGNATALKNKTLIDIHDNNYNKTSNNTNHNADVVTKGSNVGTKDITYSIKLVLHTFF